MNAIDLFCGGGGTSSGAESTGACRVKLAVNHWQTAVDTHSANFPHTTHINSRIEDVPRSAMPRRIGIMFASPECIHHSRARGGRPTSDQQRSGAWELLRWIDARRPQWIVVENVSEFVSWGAVGENGRPLKSRQGETFQAWLKAIESYGYSVDWRLLNAADFGAATSRERLFVVARKGRRSPVFPEPTHCKTPGGELPGLGLPRWRAAAEIIDWSIPCPSIFSRKRPLADKTLLRIEAGLRRFVGPFVVAWDQQSGGGGFRSPASPLSTLVTKANLGVAVPFLSAYHCGDDSARRNHGLGDALPTLDTSNRFGVAVPYLVPHFGEREGQSPRSHSLDAALPTVTGQGAGSLAVPFVLPRQGIYDSQTLKRCRGVDEPLPVITASHVPGAIVIPWLTSYYGHEQSSTPGTPLPTVTTKDRHALLTAHCGDATGLDGAGQSDAMQRLLGTMRDLGVVDIGFRMLSNPELAAAQGFPSEYIWTGNKADVTRQVGNSVSPAVAKEITKTIVGA